MIIQRAWNSKIAKSKRTSWIAMIAILTAILPIASVIATSQEANAITIASDTSLPSGSSDFCTSSTSDQIALTVTVSNTVTKLLLSTLDVYQQTFGSNNFANAVVRLESGGTLVDWANVDAEVGDFRDRGIALSGSRSTSTAKDVAIRSSESTDTVCLTSSQADLHVVY